MKGNVSVGLPIDLCTLQKDNFKISNEIQINKNDLYFKKFRMDGVKPKKGIKALPPFDFNKY